MSDLSIWKLTKLGKKVGGDIRPSVSGTEGEIIRYLYENRTASTEEIASSVGKDRMSMGSNLRKLEKKGIVVELTSKQGEL